MKTRLWNGTALVLALVLFTGASVWEGAGAVAPNGDLPAAGYYAATNSFPRNTVVDITNLESGKSIRVIVAAGLETPGLLALLSKDAAGVIGLEGRSMGRIRMTQPSDPIAFSRFTDGLAAGGLPGYDSGAVITEESLYDPAPLPAPPPAPAGRSRRESAPLEASSPGAFSVPGESALSRGERQVFPGRDEAPAFPGGAAAFPPPSSGAAGGAVPGSPAGLASSAGTPDLIPAYALEPEWEEYGKRGIVDLPEPVFAPETEAERPEVSVPGEPKERDYLAAPEEPAAAPAAESASDGAASELRYEYRLIPAEERPPEIPGGYSIDGEHLISPIPEAPVEAAETAETGPAEDYVYVSPIPDKKPVVIESPPSPADPSPFSVPLISSLERGGCYVQLAAYARPELIESEINRINTGYPLRVQNAGNEERPLYRILLGPLNLGESGAVLQRFKSIGYKDAFVRRN
jgi:hypothetical protein